jgi:hypothetical protein
MPQPFTLTPAQRANQAALRAVADRHATLEIPAAVIAHADGDDALLPRVAVVRGEVAVPGSAGRIGAAAREIRQTLAALIVARKRGTALAATVAAQVLAQMEQEADTVEALLILLRDQVNAAREDRFDAQDARRQEVAR